VLMRVSVLVQQPDGLTEEAVPQSVCAALDTAVSDSASNV